MCIYYVGLGWGARLVERARTVRRHWTAPCGCTCPGLWAVSEGRTGKATWTTRNSSLEEVNLSPVNAAGAAHRTAGTAPARPGGNAAPATFCHRRPSLTASRNRAAASAPDVTPTSSQQEGEEARERHSLLKAASGSFHLKLPLANGHAELQGDAAPVPGGHVLLLNWGGRTDEERPAGGSARPRARPRAGESRRRAASRSWGILERRGQAL